MQRPPSAPVLPQPPRGELYSAGGRRLMLLRSGTGGPTAVFLPGAGMVGLDYLTIHQQVAELTACVLYDRAGTGWSEHAELPRTAEQVTGELRELLAAAKVPGPYLLIGHSLGGAYARRYAQRFPAEVAGLLLLDPFHEDLYDRAPEQAREKLAQLHARELPEPAPEQLREARGQIAALFAAWPADVREPLAEYHLRAWRTGPAEDRNLYGEVAGELRRGPALPDVPLIVLTALGHDATQARMWTPELLREINDGKRELHARLAASVPHGAQRILPDAGHGWLHREHPEEVLRAVADLVRAARG